MSLNSFTFHATARPNASETLSGDGVAGFDIWYENKSDIIPSVHRGPDGVRRFSWRMINSVCIHRSDLGSKDATEGAIADFPDSTVLELWQAKVTEELTSLAALWASG